MSNAILSPIYLESEFVRRFEYNPPEEPPTKENNQAEFLIGTDTELVQDGDDSVLRLIGTIDVTVSKDDQVVLLVSVQGRTATVRDAIGDDMDLRKVAEFNTISLLYSYLRVLVESTTRSFGRPMNVPTLSIDAVLANEAADDTDKSDKTEN